jgi:response regulator RpfG family c-di-GMP phosphodiesterase
MDKTIDFYNAKFTELQNKALAEKGTVTLNDASNSRQGAYKEAMKYRDKIRAAAREDEKTVEEIKTLSSGEGPVSPRVQAIVNALKEINNNRNLTPDQRKKKTDQYIDGVAEKLGVKTKDIKAKLKTQLK